MTQIIARGRKQVQKYERALGGEPRRSTLRRAQSELSRWFTERTKKRPAVHDEIESIRKRRRELILRQIEEANTDLKKENAKLRRLFHQRAKRKIARPRLRKIEPCIGSGSLFAIHTPPYDGGWNASTSDGSANDGALNGSYDLGVQSIGTGNQEAAAGLCSNFFCTDAAIHDQADPTSGQRFAAVIEYSDDWWDVADFYVAHNDFRTRLWVWGQTENTWVWQADVQPSWSDAANWLDEHGNDPQGDAGVIAVETYFSVMANSWYQAWAWSDAQVFGDSGAFGYGASSTQFSATVPLMVFGSLG